MRIVARWAGCLTLGCVLSAAAHAQNVKPATTNPDRPVGGPRDRIRQPVGTSDSGLHTMEIYNGPVRTVGYFTPRGARVEQDALTNLSRAENQVSLADQLLSLRRQYAADESRLEARRSNVQETFYGFGTSLA